MVDAVTIALSGMNAQGMKLAASANNIANATTEGRIPTAQNPNSTVYKPLEVNINSATANGEPAGVSYQIKEKENGYSVIYSPNSDYADSQGMIAVPNVNLAEESVNMMNAKMIYKASAKVIKVENEMQGELLDTIS